MLGLSLIAFISGPCLVAYSEDNLAGTGLSFWDVSRGLSEFTFSPESSFDPDFGFFREEIEKKNGITIVKQSGILPCSGWFIAVDGCSGVVSDCITLPCPDYSPAETVIYKVVLDEPIMSKENPFFSCIEQNYNQSDACASYQNHFNATLNCRRAIYKELENCLDRASELYSPSSVNHDQSNKYKNSDLDRGFQIVDSSADDNSASDSRCIHDDSICQDLGDIERAECIETKNQEYIWCIDQTGEDDGASYTLLILTSLVIISAGGATIFFVRGRQIDPNT